MYCTDMVLLTLAHGGGCPSSPRLPRHHRPHQPPTVFQLLYHHSHAGNYAPKDGIIAVQVGHVFKDDPFFNKALKPLDRVQHRDNRGRLARMKRQGTAQFHGRHPGVAQQ